MKRTAPAGDDIRKNTASAETEERNGDRQKREVVEVDHRKYAGERELEHEGGKRGGGNPEVDLRPMPAAGRLRERSAQ